MEKLNTKSLEDRLGGLHFKDLARPVNIESLMAIETHPPEILSDFQTKFLEDGVLIMKNILPDQITDNYIRLRESLPKDRSIRDNYYGGWHYPTPYMDHPELRKLATWLPLSGMLSHLVQEDMGLHLCLTGWVSTERNFHQDTYLNPIQVGNRYLAVWMALDDIHPGSGPFEFVRGSHKWDALQRDLLFKHLTPEERTSPHWPTFTQDIIATCCIEEILTRGGTVEQYLPKKGDVLIWHSNLVHRGSRPSNPQLLRRSLICHYSSVRHRVDMPNWTRDPDSGVYFVLPSTGEVRPK